MSCITANSINSGVLNWMNDATTTAGSNYGYKDWTNKTTPYYEFHASIPTYDQKIESINKKIEYIYERLDDEVDILANDIINIKIFKENKVVGITFYDGTKIKTICSDNDEFSLEYACYLALAKKIYAKKYTFEGVLCKADELQQIKSINKMVIKAIKQYYNEEKAKAEEKEVKARRLEKKRKKKKNKQVKEIQEIMNQLYDPMVKMAKEINNPISQIAQTINK